MWRRALAQGFFPNLGWGHWAAWGTQDKLELKSPLRASLAAWGAQVRLELKSPLRTCLYSHRLIYFVTVTRKIQ